MSSYLAPVHLQIDEVVIGVEIALKKMGVMKYLKVVLLGYAVSKIFQKGKTISHLLSSSWLLVSLGS